MRSTCGPRSSRTDALCAPAPITCSTGARVVNRSIRAVGSLGFREEIQIADRLPPAAERACRRERNQPGRVLKQLHDAGDDPLRVAERHPRSSPLQPVEPHPDRLLALLAFHPGGDRRGRGRRVWLPAQRRAERSARRRAPLRTRAQARGPAPPRHPPRPISIAPGSPTHRCSSGRRMRAAPPAVRAADQARGPRPAGTPTRLAHRAASGRAWRRGSGYRGGAARPPGDPRRCRVRPPRGSPRRPRPARPP